MSVNAVDQTTGNTTPLAGNTNNLVGNLSALTTNTKSDAVGAINEVNQTKQNATDNNLQTTDKTIVGGINELRSGLTKVATLSDNILINTQKGALYRSSPIPITCDSEPTNVVVSVTRESGAIIGAMVHSISGKTVNVIIWAAEETQEQMKVVLFYR